MSSTASAIVADTASGHHHLKIDGYSSTKALRNGRCIKSSPFTVVGHRWSIKYYPNGKSRWTDRHISLVLVLDEEVASPVTARVQLGFAPPEELRALCLGFCGKSKPAPLFKSGDENFGSYGQLASETFVKRKALEKSKHLRGDSFTVRCDIVVIEGFHAQEGAPPAKTPAAPPPRVSVSVPPSDLNRHLLDLFETGNGADVAFEVAGETFAAHRWLLAARSPALGAELLGPTNERAGVVRVDNMEARVFRALLCFIYTDALPADTTAKPEEEDAAMAQHLLVAAHRYGMERLKLVCEEQLCNNINVGNAASILALAEPLGCHGLKDAVFDFLSSPANLKAVMASDGFEQLSTTCPSAVKQLIAMCSRCLLTLPAMAARSDHGFLLLEEGGTALS